MANYSGATPVEYSRFLGFVDVSDPASLPIGCAALAQNCRFTLIEVETRYGIQTAIQGKNQSPITGLLGCAYTPEKATESYFQAILLYDYAGSLQIENPTGTGRTESITGDLVTLPASSHMIGTQAYNRAWMAFSDLKEPTSFPSVYDLYTKTLYPYGMKPLGFAWYAGAQVLAGEVCVPSAIQDGVTVDQSNGHLYICTTAGTCGNIQPTWPTTESGTVTDGTAVWTEQTPVLANRLPDNPDSPTLMQSSGAGSFASGRDVYIMLTVVNAQGESLTSSPVFVTTTSYGTAVLVSIPVLASFKKWIQSLATQYIPTGCQIYEADVATGAAAPNGSEYRQVSGGPFSLGSTSTITATASTTIEPPMTNSARVTGGMLPTPTAEPGLVRTSGGGTFVSGRDVYVLQTYVNNNGETLPGPANSVINTVADDAVTATTIGPTGYDITAVKLYECDVPTGTTFGGSAYPPSSYFALVGSFNKDVTVTITTTATGAPPPTVNSTGTTGNIAADTSTGGAGSTQGYRYMCLAYQDEFYSISGFTQAVPQSIYCDVDDSGYEIAAFNLPTGPSYIKNLILGFTVADGTSAGPFAYVPEDYTDAGVMDTSTVVANGTTQGIFNFTDTYLTSLQSSAQTNITDRLRVIQPQKCVDIYYSPSTDRIFQTGVPGYYSSHWVSLAADAESYYGDTGLITVGNDDGERAICVREYRGTLYSLRERSGAVITPSSGDPSTWDVTNRWTKVGPCGPRAVDVCGEFMIFVHSSGIWKYESSYPELVSKEIPRWWNTINWKYAHKIWCAIDPEEHEVRFGFPVGSSTVPNVTLTLNYEEGWERPLQFSRYMQKEITVESCRKYSVDSICGNLGGRFYRTITGEPDPDEGPVDTVEEIERQYISQFLVASSGPDGTVQAITPGVYNDNGSGIDCRYEGISEHQMLSLCKLNGINVSVRGNGQLFVSFIPGARRTTDWAPGQPEFEVKLRPFDLELIPTKSISRNTPSRLNERWRPCFSNGKVADAWFSLKYATVFVSPMFQGRTSLES
jgi:hypothetical protein